jgi:hypothetical protein
VRTPRAASAVADLKDGLREVMRHSWLWLLILQALLYHLFYGGAQAVLGPVVVGQGIGRSAWGLALAVLMAGFVTGGLLCLRIRPLSDTLWPVLLGAFLHGLGLQMFDVYWEQSIQSHVPEDKLARVYAFDTVGSFVARPVGLALTGPVATAVGFDTWLLVVAAVISGVSLVALAARGVRDLERVYDSSRSRPERTAPGASSRLRGRCGRAMPHARARRTTPVSNGHASSSTITPYTVTANGVFTRPVTLPSLICRARRSCCSALGPRMTPITAGRIGRP